MADQDTIPSNKHFITHHFSVYIPPTGPDSFVSTISTKQYSTLTNLKLHHRITSTWHFFCYGVLKILQPSASGNPLWVSPLTVALKGSITVKTMLSISTWIYRIHPLVAVTEMEQSKLFLPENSLDQSQRLP